MDIEGMPGCCGAFVINEFNDLTDCDEYYTREQVIREFHDRVSSAPSGKLLICILIDSQLHQGWLSVVQKAGFRRVSRWINNNHGNVCNMFVKYKGDLVSPKYKANKTLRQILAETQIDREHDVIVGDVGL